MEGSLRDYVGSRTSYDYFVKLDLDFNDEANLYKDVNRDTLQLVAEELIRSHIFSAVGPCLYLAEDIILLIDYSMTALQTHPDTRANKTYRIYYNGKPRRSPYRYLTHGYNRF